MSLISKSARVLANHNYVRESVAELSSSCDVVLSCLPSDEAVLNIYEGPDGAPSPMRFAAH